MKKKNGVLIIAIIGILLIGIGAFVYFKPKKEDKIDNKTDHRDEFNIVESNYLERNYKRYVEFKDKNSNKYTDDQVITYVNIGLDKADYEDPTETKEEDGILKITNKHNVISENFTPKLVEDNSYNREKAEQIDEELAKAFKEMAAAAKEKSDVDLFIVRGYSSYEIQNAYYVIQSKEEGEKAANSHCAKAGYSDYQTGLAVSINGTSDGFKYSFPYSWLIEHGYEYGFILRYPEGKEEITGCAYEPWHFRYVGKDAARVIHDKNITFEEYYATYVLK